LVFPVVSFLLAFPPISYMHSSLNPTILIPLLLLLIAHVHLHNPAQGRLAYRHCGTAAPPIATWYFIYIYIYESFFL
jgi:hypothetical protein